MERFEAMPPGADGEDVEVLMQRYVEGVLTEREAEALHRLLEKRPELGERLLRQMEVDAMLRATRELAVVRGESRVPALLPKRRFTLTTVAWTAAAAACIGLSLAWLGARFLPRDEPGVVAGEGAGEEWTASVAVLARVVNAEWETAALEAGTPLSPGRLRLRSGLVEIEFYQGARVLLEGPAEFELVSSGEATCVRGKLSAEVPPLARGFKINTPSGAVVDLGTEFGLEVNQETAEVHVFQGEVELHPKAEAMRELREGEALSFAGKPVALAANRAGFASLSELDAKTADAQRGQLERWLSAGDQWNGDADLRVRFDFQAGAGGRALANRAVQGRDIADGSIVGAGWTQGRWPGKGALEFRNVSDRVRLAVPGELGQLTLAAWVRVNGLDRAFNSLFMSEGWGDRRVHWQITRAGCVRLGVAGTGRVGHEDYDTPVVFSPERLGRWTHLAVVFDSQAREVRHYVNGALAAREAMGEAAPLRIGIAELGNWNDRPGAQGVAIRHLSGAMDEFALWQRVLSDDEIARLAK